MDDKDCYESEIKLKKYEYKCACNLKKYEYDCNCQLENFKKVIELGQSTINSAILINGGAAAGLLTFLGNLFMQSPTLAKKISNSLFLFCFGLVLAGGAFGFTYLSQKSYGVEKETRGHIFYWITFLLVVGAYVCFICGMYISYSAFSKYGL